MPHVLLPCRSTTHLHPTTSSPSHPKTRHATPYCASRAHARARQAVHAFYDSQRPLIEASAKNFQLVSYWGADFKGLDMSLDWYQLHGASARVEPAACGRSTAPRLNLSVISVVSVVDCPTPEPPLVGGAAPAWFGHRAPPRPPYPPYYGQGLSPPFLLWAPHPPYYGQGLSPPFLIWAPHPPYYGQGLSPPFLIWAGTEPAFPNMGRPPLRYDAALVAARPKAGRLPNREG